MIRVRVYYPNQPGVDFDHDYYAEQHAGLVVERLSPVGLRKAEIDRGTAGLGDGQAPFVGGGRLYFDSLDAFPRAWAEHGQEITADIPSYTNAKPVVQISGIAVEWPG